MSVENIERWQKNDDYACTLLKYTGKCDNPTISSLADNGENSSSSERLGVGIFERYNEWNIFSVNVLPCACLEMRYSRKPSEPNNGIVRESCRNKSIEQELKTCSIVCQEVLREMRENERKENPSK